jgi:valyl-tRNA synthetase
MLFVNKLWNASRFVHANTSLSDFSFNETQNLLSEKYEDLLLHEKWILSKLSGLIDLVSESMENHSFSEAGQELYIFTKNRFCDYYIEEFKLSKNISEY